MTKFRIPYTILAVLPKPKALSILPFQIPKTKCGIVFMSVSPMIKSIIFNVLKIQYRFNAEPWKYSGPNGWYFISVPKKLSKEIRETFKSEEQGWGRLPIRVKIGKTEWESAIWFDTKVDTYLLPLKAEVRKKEQLQLGKKISVDLFI